MKRVTASEARRNWFHLLDEVAAGGVVMIERGGRRIVLRREDPASDDTEVPDYAAILQVAEPERADEWRWHWPGEEGDLALETDADEETAAPGTEPTSEQELPAPGTPASDPDVHAKERPPPPAGPSGPVRRKKGGPGGRGPW